MIETVFAGCMFKPFEKKQASKKGIGLTAE
jgi:hypothetical protein